MTVKVFYDTLLPSKQSIRLLEKEEIKVALKKKTTKKVTPLFSADDIGKLGREYAEISAQIKELEEKKKALADKIKKGAEQFGVKDDKGSFFLESDTHIMGKVAKKSIKIDQDKAVGTLESMGLGDVVDIVTVKTVNEERLERAVADKRITLYDVQGFTDVKVSYSVSVKEKEVATEVEQSTLKVAKRK